jgi:hypothetical protein
MLTCIWIDKIIHNTIQHWASWLQRKLFLVYIREVARSILGLDADNSPIFLWFSSVPTDEIRNSVLKKSMAVSSPTRSSSPDTIICCYQSMLKIIADVCTASILYIHLIECFQANQEKQTIAIMCFNSFKHSDYYICYLLSHLKPLHFAKMSYIGRCVSLWFSE